MLKLYIAEVKSFFRHLWLTCSLITLGISVTEITKRSTAIPCLTENVDLVIVFDVSTSVEGVFEHQKELTLHLIDRLPISTDGRIAVSLVSYTDSPR